MSLVVPCRWLFCASCSIRDGKLYDYNLRRTVEDFTAFAEGAYAKVEAKEIPAGAPSPPPPLFLLFLLR